MTHAHTVTIRAALGAMLGIACLVPAPTMAWDQNPQGKCVDPRGCGASPSPAPGGGGYSAPSYDYEAERRAQEAAAAERQRRQAEADHIERERLAAEQRKKEKEAVFIRDRDAAANTLKGSSGSAMSQLKGLAGADSSGLKGSGFDQGGQLKSAPGADTSVVDNRNEPAGLGGKSNFKGAFAKPAPPVPSGDPMVVDARNVPSGLPKALDNAIATAYSAAPPGVSDRVRKGFQAVMDRDWKVAKAWFQDALNRDPNNAGLKRLVAITDSSQQANPQPTTVDNRNEPTGLGGKSDFKGTFAKPSQTKPAPVSATDPNDIGSLFPGLQAMKDKEEPVFKTLPDGRVVQMPQASDMEFLFDLRGTSSASPASAPKPTPTFIIGKNGQLIQIPENSDQKSRTYTIGKDGNLIELPHSSDLFFLFPENGPATTPKPAGESGKTK